MDRGLNHPHLHLLTCKSGQSAFQAAPEDLNTQKTVANFHRPLTVLGSGLPSHALPRVILSDLSGTIFPIPDKKLPTGEEVLPQTREPVGNGSKRDQILGLCSLYLISTPLCLSKTFPFLN